MFTSLLLLGRGEGQCSALWLPEELSLVGGPPLRLPLLCNKSFYGIAVNTAILFCSKFGGSEIQEGLPWAAWGLTWGVSSSHRCGMNPKAQLD